MISNNEVINAYVSAGPQHPSELRPVGYYLQDSGYTDSHIHHVFADMELKGIIINRAGLSDLRPFIEIHPDHIPLVDKRIYRRYT